MWLKIILKATKKWGIHPVSRKNILGKTTGGDQINHLFSGKCNVLEWQQRCGKTSCFYL